MLYFVPTPIGNLGDITYRAVEVLKSVDLVYAEDTRVAKRLLTYLKIDKPIQSFHQNNEHRILDKAIEYLTSFDAAYISDAGTPAISDPGFLLARACAENKVEMTCLPGATALIPALVCSGIPCDKFHFEGFLPHKKGRQTRLEILANYPNTFVLYESPHRIKKCIDQLILHCGPDRNACAAREISKMYEEFIRGTLEEVKAALEAKPSIKGEFVVVVEGLTK